MANSSEFFEDICDNELASLGHAPQRRLTNPMPQRNNTRTVRTASSSNVPSGSDPKNEKNEGFFKYFCSKVFRKKQEINKPPLKKSESQPTLIHQPIKRYSIEQEIPIEEYAWREWQSSKPNAIKMRNGYSQVKQSGYLFIRRIRGDNYCALRSVLFQLLTFGDVTKTVLAIFPTVDKAIERLNEVNKDHGHYLKTWTFGQNIRMKNGNSTVDAIQGCIETFYQIVNEISSKEGEKKKREFLVTELNTEKDQFFETDAKLVEFIKFLMFSKAAELYRKLEMGQDVPLWFQFLTLRDQSGTLEDFLKFHLNMVGDSLGLEQIEMFLLGCALNLRIRAFRLKSLGEDDFETLYPPEDDTSLPLDAATLPLTAEDDRHYNVVYK